MKRSFLSVLLILALCAVSCTQKESVEGRVVSLTFCETGLKTTLNTGRTSLQWCDGDAVTIFNDSDASAAEAVYSPSGNIKVNVPDGATVLKAVYPKTEGSYSEPGHVFLREQTQASAGVLNGACYPLEAVADIVDNTAELHFETVGAAFAVNVFGPQFAGEKLLSLSVKPSQLAQAVKVTLGTPWEIVSEKPADKKTFAGQIYACLEKGGYSKITFNVRTDRCNYTITSNETVMDLQSSDFFAVNLDLSHLSVTITPTVEGFDEQEEDVTDASTSFVDLVEYPSDIQLTDDIIPDFSTVGYRWGERPYPNYSNTVKLPPPSGGDDTPMIQNAIDSAPERTVIEFQEGRYIVDGLLIVDKNGIILRGAPERKTEIFARGTVPFDDNFDPTASGVFYAPIRKLICVGVSDKSSRTTEYSASVANINVKNKDGKTMENHPDAWYVHGTQMKNGSVRTLGNATDIIEDAYCGSRFVTVSDPTSFNVGDKVVIYRPATQEWIHDLKMDMIIKALNDVGTITQWSPQAYGIYWERVITAVHGNLLYFDAPLVMSITQKYGGGSVIHCSQPRIKECGIENLKLVSDYNPDRDYEVGGRLTHGDIYHADTAINFFAAEHCWVKNVETCYFSSCAVAMSAGARNITVEGCDQREPAAYIRGGLRYAFHVDGGQFCLIRDCTSDWDRHQWVTAQKIPGPNVFFNCTSTNAQSNIGPHQRWATGTLYDHVTTTREVSVNDAGNSGTGQGWQGVNQVFWRCRGNKYIIQHPWVTGYNYAIGCRMLDGSDAVLSEATGYANPGYAPDGSVVYDSEVNGTRPNGICRQLEPGEPESLYLYQLQQRLASGNLISNIVGD